MRILELFSGTGSVGKICKELGYEVISLDLKNADINCNIMDWDYTIFPKNHFDIIWASPPCNSFSCLQYALKTKENMLKHIEETGLPILRKTEEIIDYFSPKYYFIENPQTGLMKNYLHRPYYDVDYCRYSDWGYRKRTRIWTNIVNFNSLLCNKECGNMIKIDNKYIHKKNCGRSFYSKLTGTNTSLNERYRIPPLLIKSLFSHCD
jgi:site-specific DNA-cytosine methylase